VKDTDTFYTYKQTNKQTKGQTKRDKRRSVFIKLNRGDLASKRAPEHVDNLSFDSSIGVGVFVILFLRSIILDAFQNITFRQREKSRRRRRKRRKYAQDGKAHRTTSINTRLGPKKEFFFCFV